MQTNSRNTVGLILSIIIAICMILPVAGIIGEAEPAEKIDLVVAFDLDSKDINIKLALESLGSDISVMQTNGVGRAWISVNPAMIDRISQIPGVSAVIEDTDPIEFLDLISSNTYMGHDAAQVGGFTGSGILVEVQDGGCQVTHPDFDVDVIRESCKREKLRNILSVDAIVANQMTESWFFYDLDGIYDYLGVTSKKRKPLAKYKNLILSFIPILPKDSEMFAGTELEHLLI